MHDDFNIKPTATMMVDLVCFQSFEARNQHKNSLKYKININGNNMKKERKQQDDRLLKRLNHQDRRAQEKIRTMILKDPAFRFA